MLGWRRDFCWWTATYRLGPASKVDVFVLELGSNDALRGIDLETTRNHLQGIIDKVRYKYPEIALVIVGMQMPPNMGVDYTEEFRTLFPELAEKNDAALVPFLLEGVVLVPDEERLFRGNHPTKPGSLLKRSRSWDHSLLSGMG